VLAERMRVRRAVHLDRHQSHAFFQSCPWAPSSSAESSALLTDVVGAVASTWPTGTSYGKSLPIRSMKRVAAARARRLGNELLNDEDRAGALRFADELDAQADELQRALEDRSPPLP
jgi:hypothetical protein